MVAQNVIAIFASSLIPNSRIKTGYSVTTGIDRKKSITDSNDLYRNPLTPISNPKKTPNVEATKKAENTRCKVCTISLSKLLYKNKLVKAENVLEGEGNKVGSSKLKLETTCQMTKIKAIPTNRFSIIFSFSNSIPPYFLHK